MGGSGGGPFKGAPPEDLQRKIRQQEEQEQDEGFRRRISSKLDDLLGDYNSRDNNLVRERLDGLRDTLSEEIQETIDVRFGGSVAKHTYIDGLSDIDSLVLFPGHAVFSSTPYKLLQHLADIISSKAQAEEIAIGRLAVTVQYPDGMEVQLLPAYREQSGAIHIPSADGKRWSEVDPRKFAQKLTSVNQKCGNKLVPTIKLAKAINSTLPEGVQLSGYHIESLAIDVFRNYTGPASPAAMLPHFFEKASNRITVPITDRSGQSVHVDDYMGPRDSESRKRASKVLDRIARRMRNATGAQSTEAWMELFGE